MSGTTLTCPKCFGMGWRVVARDGREVATTCECRAERKRSWTVDACRIPARYAHCTVDDFEIWSSDRAERHLQSQARTATARFIDGFPCEKGLMFVGPPGTGKTHLAVAALRGVVSGCEASGLYVNFIDLVQQLQMSFDRNGTSREEILAPVTDADLLVLDELGAGKMTEWVRDLLYFVINSRYMSRRLTVFTSNYFDAPQPSRERAAGPAPATATAASERWRETLADRIGEHLRSRLYEMCTVVELRGADYRVRGGVGRGTRA